MRIMQVSIWSHKFVSQLF